jgi:hypothetical protein
MAARMAMMAMTTSNSIKVKAAVPFAQKEEQIDSHLWADFLILINLFTWQYPSSLNFQFINL